MSTIRPALWSDLTAEGLAAALAGPPSRYRPVPWLAWSGEMHWEGLRAQLDDMREQGITEFFLFPVYGMELPYMSLAYWQRVQQTLQHCREHGMRCWIYDEYNWPSGICAGTVIRDYPETREQLLWVRHELEGEQPSGLPPNVTATRHSGGAEWATAEGFLCRTSVTGGDWVGRMPGYLDMLSPAAVERFLASTHQRYYDRAPEMFAAGGTLPPAGGTLPPAGGTVGLPAVADTSGGTVGLPAVADTSGGTVGLPAVADTSGGTVGLPAVADTPVDDTPTIPGFFTDEPGFCHPRVTPGWLALPYTPGLFEAFQGRYGYDLREVLGDLVQGSPTAARTRCHYWRLVAETYGQAYGGTIRRWCDEHGVALTGHCLGEEMLSLHVRMEGDLWEAMRHYTIPGIDMLSNADGFTYPEGTSFYGALDRRAFHLTCKVVHAVCRHSGSREMMSEAYGVCDFGLNLLRQKRGFHYQVALGVTLFNDNTLITSMADFRKYVIGGKHFTQPWWQHYKQYADYNARLAALHAEGEPQAEVAVLYPRSTLWALADGAMFGQSWADLAGDHPLAALQEQVYDLLDELIREQWSFDFVFEPVLAAARVEGQELVTDHCRYRVIVVPSATCLPADCLAVLEQFAAAGGRLVLSGELPRHEADSQADLGEAVRRLLALPSVEHVGAAGAEVRGALARLAQPAITLEGARRREFVSSWRRLADSDFVFLANMTLERTAATVTPHLPGPLTVLDPSSLQAFRPEPGEGSFRLQFAPAQAYLLVSGPAAEALLTGTGGTAGGTVGLPAVSGLPAGGRGGLPAVSGAAHATPLTGEWGFAVEPGNMLKLALQARPDPENAGAAKGWQHDTGAAGWVTPEDGALPEAIRPDEAPWYWLRAELACEPGAAPRTIVVDSPQFLELFVNGRPAQQVAGEPLWGEENVHYEVGALLREGRNTVHVRVRTSKYNDPRIAPFPGLVNRLLQPVVLLGDFRVQGQRLLPPADRIRTDRPWEQQGFPCFAGVGVYRRTVQWHGGSLYLLLGDETHEAVEVRVNGRTVGRSAWPPYVFDLGEGVREGDNEVQVRVSNTLGNLITRTYGGAVPPAYPTSGLLSAPVLLRAEEPTP